MDAKRFDEWNAVAKTLHDKSPVVEYHEREIWWCSIGENIGSEINGKGESFLRPVLIVRKYGNLFFGIPLSSQHHTGMWYAQFEHKQKYQCALLSQSSTFSSNRLQRKIGRLSVNIFIQVCSKLELLLFRKKYLQPYQ